MKSSLFIWPLLFSCSHQYVINSHNCPTKMAQFGEAQGFEISHRIMTPFSTEKELEVNLAEILGQEDISCSDVGKLSVVMKNTWLDSFLNILPLIDSKTIVIKGKKISHDGSQGNTKDGSLSLFIHDE